MYVHVCERDIKVDLFCISAVVIVTGLKSQLHVYVICVCVEV